MNTAGNLALARGIYWVVTGLLAISIACLVIATRLGAWVPWWAWALMAGAVCASVARLIRPPRSPVVVRLDWIGLTITSIGAIGAVMHLWNRAVT